MAAKEKKPKPPKPKKEKKGKKGAAPEAAGEDGDAKPAAEAGEGGDAGDGEGAAKKKLAGKTLVLFIIAPLVLILGGGGAAGYFLFFNKPAGEQHADAGEHGKKKKDKKEHAGKEGEASPVTEGDGVFYYALPEMLVNITSGDGRPVYLKLKLTLEAPNEDVIDAIEPELPRVIDEYQAFLRELRVDDLAGSAGAYRLRLELLRRANLAIAPAQINAVLIEEMLVQ